MAFSYSVPNAAKELNVSKTTVWREIAAGRLSTFKMRGRTLISHQELVRYEAQSSMSNDRLSKASPRR